MAEITTTQLRRAIQTLPNPNTYGREFCQIRIEEHVPLTQMIADTSPIVDMPPVLTFRKRLKRSAFTPIAEWVLDV